jgi:Fe-S cluster assembly iron-binding protein IscA
MIHVTAEAREVLRQVIEANVDEPGMGLRLEVTDAGSLALHPDAAQDDDEVVEDDGEILLLLDAALAETLDGAILDCRRVADGAQLIVKRRRVPPDDRQVSHA